MARLTSDHAEISELAVGLTSPLGIDTHVYKERHLVENFFCKIKRYRRVAMRFEKTAANFLGFVLFAAIRVWLA